MSSYNGIPCSPEVAEFLVADDEAERRNEMNRGLVFRPDPDGFLRDVVEDYLATFGWCGVSLRDIVESTGRDERWIKRTVKDMVGDGKLRVEESLTRGPRASKRKRYYWNAARKPVIESLALKHDSVLMDGTNEYGTGGGRSIPPRGHD